MNLRLPFSSCCLIATLGLGATTSGLFAASGTPQPAVEKNPGETVPAAPSATPAPAAKTEACGTGNLNSEQKLAAPTPACDACGSADSCGAKDAPPESELAATKEKLARTEAELEAALRTYTLLKEDSDKVSALSATQQAQLAEVVNANTSRNAAELLTLREILRQTRDTNATLVAENARLQTTLARSSPARDAGPATPSLPPTAVAPMPPLAIPDAASPAVSAPAAAPAPRHHTIAKGDTLTRISRKYYGTTAHWQEILTANSTVIKDPKVLPNGAELVIP